MEYQWIFLFYQRLEILLYFNIFKVIAESNLVLDNLKKDRMILENDDEKLELLIKEIEQRTLQINLEKLKLVLFYIFI
jgi:hypothetical protein